MAYPNRWKAKELAKYITNPDTQSLTASEGWFAARPLGFASLGNRLSCAWQVFTGKADIVIWPN